MAELDYDLLVIGAGSGGIAAARRAASHGARVGLIEDGRVGGTCVLRGCVPKKLLMYAAQSSDLLAEAVAYGWEGTEVASARFDMARWQARKTHELARLEAIYHQLLEGSGVALIRGRARVDGLQAVVVRAPDGTEHRLRAHDLLLATGAAPVRDSIPGIASCATSDDLLDLDALPAAAAVVGGGYIGVEFASMLARLGVEVHLFFRDRAPLRGFDEMLRSHAVAALSGAGVTLHPASVPSRIIQPLTGGWLLQFGEERALPFPWVLNATGRRPVTSGMGLDTVGLAPGPRGEIAVDGFGHTGVPHLHAIGDVTDRKNLTPVAIAEGRALADRLFGGTEPRVLDPEQIGSAVFMIPPLASIGPSEATLHERGVPLRVFETDFRPMRSAFIGGAERSRMKLLVHAENDRVLAVHMAGPDAPEIVQSLAVALAAGATKAHFDRTVAMHPTAAEEFVLMRQPAR